MKPIWSRVENNSGRLAVFLTCEADDGTEEELELPAKHAVCRKCEGHGTHLRDGMREHAYTREEFEEAFHDEEDRAEYFKRGGIYDVQCTECSGLRVVVAVDRARAKSDLGYRRAWLEYQRQIREERDYQALCASERRWEGLEG